MDRVVEIESYYRKENGIWWQLSEIRTRPEENSASVLTTAVKKVQLNELGITASAGRMTGKEINIDLFGNETTVQKYTDRNNRKVTTVTDVPDSTTDVTVVKINGNTQFRTSKENITVRYEYDSLGRLTGTVHPRTGLSRTHYNHSGQIDWQEDAATNRTWFAYDAQTGLRVAITNALGNTTLYGYNERGETVILSGTSQYPVRYEYDDFGRMTSLYTMRSITSGWDRTQWRYDEATGLVTNKLYADGNGPFYTYTADGKLSVRTWARGVTTAYGYDSVGQLTNTVYSDGTPAVSIAYNRRGNKTKVIDASGTNTFYYNGVMQLTGEVNESRAYHLSRSYDSLGRASGITSGDDYQVLYDYGEDGRFNDILSTVSGQTNHWQYSYLEDSGLISQLTETETGFSVHREYESNRNLVTSIESGMSGNAIVQYEYVYDELGRRIARQANSAGSMDLFEYNAKNELIHARIWSQSNPAEYSYIYDEIGNRKTQSQYGNIMAYTANSLNQYLQITDNLITNNCTYDTDGNLLTYNGWTYVWNGENRLIQASGNAGTIKYEYDQQGRMFQRIINNETNSYIWDKLNIIAEISIVGTNYNIWGIDLSGTLKDAGGVGGLLGVIRHEGGASNLYFPGYDANGNITDYFDQTGVVFAHREYSPFGKIIAFSGSKKDDFTFWFSTKMLEKETGLIHYEFRQYSVILGKWMSRDPLMENGGFNLYVFCKNSPVQNIDYLGLDNLYLGGDTFGQNAPPPGIDSDGSVIGGGQIEPFVDFVLISEMIMIIAVDIYFFDGYYSELIIELIVDLLAQDMGNRTPEMPPPDPPTRECPL